jgi:PHD/YefM family antitoxin component YafN of YafNO toxin-antitoxin module
MGLRRNKSLIDQASDYVEELIPQLEAAVLSARDKAAPIIADARDKAAPVIADARDKAAPVIADARAKAAPVIADARAKAAPVLADGAAYAADKAALGAALAAEKAQQASELAAAKAAEIKEEQEGKKGGKLKKLLLLGGIAALGAFVYKKLTSDAGSDNWQSSYTPTPAPKAAAPTAATTKDAGGSSPDEALSDAAEEPHPPSTPSEPAEVVEIDPEAAAAAEAAESNGTAKGGARKA